MVSILVSHLVKWKWYYFHFYDKEVPFNQHLEIEKINGMQVDDCFEVFHLQMPFIFRTPMNQKLEKMLWRILIKCRVLHSRV